MSIAHSHLKTAAALVQSYQRGKPLVHHLKTYFSQHKQMGSRDRKVVSRLCYAYFRCFGCLSSFLQTEEKIIASLFLCQHEADPLLEKLNPLWNLKCHLTFAEKCDFLGLDASRFFSFNTLLSPQLNVGLFSESLLIQPDLFLRIRPGYQETVIAKLNEAKIKHEISGNSLRLDNGSQLDQVLILEKEVVVQDMSTQKTFDQLDVELLPNGEVAVWDCCAASGGKSILISDLLGKRIKLTATDIRKNMLSNLKDRLQKGSVRLHHSFSADLTIQTGMLATEQFDLIIADVPCSGSGTWSRTPEQHFSFRESDLSLFVKKQRAIIHNVVPHLKKGGVLVYSTCSVFHAENENQVSYFIDKYDLKLNNASYYDGTSLRSDTLYSAMLTHKG